MNDKKISTGTLRKRASRLRRAKLGIKVVEVHLSENERIDLDALREIRGGENGAYTSDEYISTLIRRDKERLHHQLKAEHCCEGCNKTFPKGVTGPIKHDTTFWHPIGRKDLEL